MKIYFVVTDIVNDVTYSRKSFNTPLSALELKLSGLIMESRVDTAGDNQNVHVIICNKSVMTIRVLTLLREYVICPL